MAEYLQPACHDGTPSVTIQCTCGEYGHLHESQLGSVPKGQGIATSCKACGKLLTFEPEFFVKALADMRAEGVLAPHVSSPERPVCPGCGTIAFLLCLGGCYQGGSHRHHARCLICGYRWRLRCDPIEVVCRECGKAGRETLDDSNPGLCADCHKNYLAALATKLPGMLEAHEPTVAAAWAKAFLMEEAGMPEDWAEVMSASMLTGRNYLVDPRGPLDAPARGDMAS